MADYIDRKELLEDLERFAPEGRAALLIVRKQKSVDAVPVVRCKDCKHGILDEEDEMYKCVYSAEFDDETGEYYGFVDYNRASHFCSYGERRDNG